MASEKRMIPQYISLKLHEIPVWVNVPLDEEIDVNRILEVLVEIDQYPTDVIRQGASDFYESTTSLEDMGRLLLLNKFLFELPEWVAIHSYRRFGGWLGIPEKQGQINLLWPFSRSKSGTLALTQRFSGYLGEAYLALEAFDYYLKSYGRRNSGKQAKGEQ